MALKSKTVNNSGTWPCRRLFCLKPLRPFDGQHAFSCEREQVEKVVGRVGIEPTTSRLKAECSTSELTPHPGIGRRGCHRNAGGIIPDKIQMTSAI